MRGETLVIPDLMYVHKEWDLSYDEQVKCLSYLIRHLSNFCAMPQGLKARVTSVPSITWSVRASASEGYPGISLYAEDDADIDVNTAPNPLDLEEKLDLWIRETGKQQLLQLSAEKTRTWQDVVEAEDNVVPQNRVELRNSEFSAE